MKRKQFCARQTRNIYVLLWIGGASLNLCTSKKQAGTDDGTKTQKQIRIAKWADVFFPPCAVVSLLLCYILDLKVKEFQNVISLFDGFDCSVSFWLAYLFAHVKRASESKVLKIKILYAKLTGKWKWACEAQTNTRACTKNGLAKNNKVTLIFFIASLLLLRLLGSFAIYFAFSLTQISCCRGLTITEASLFLSLPACLQHRELTSLCLRKTLEIGSLKKCNTQFYLSFFSLFPLFSFFTLFSVPPSTSSSHNVPFLNACVLVA